MTAQVGVPVPPRRERDAQRQTALAVARRHDVPPCASTMERLMDNPMPSPSALELSQGRHALRVGELLATRARLILRARAPRPLECRS